MRRSATIRNLFLHKKSHYSLPEAASVLRWSIAKLAEEVAAMELLPVNADALIPWQTLAALAITEWSPEMIEGALGAEVAAVLPALSCLDRLCVRLPRYQIVALEAAARRRRETINAFLSRYLLDQTCIEAPSLVRTVTGFREAYLWPQLSNSQPSAPANFGVKLARPGFGPAAELPTSSPA
jgi:hypothetical protein